MTKQEFISKLAPLAVADMRQSNILASLTLAQACVETGWGGSAIMMKYNALFGIKAGSSWKGKVYSAKTQECYDGVNFTTITDLFRAYDSWEESVADYSALLTGATRYKAVVGETDYKKACRAVHAAGYATDPSYADKLIQIIEQNKFYEYDKQSGQPETKNTTVTAILGATKYVFDGKELAEQTLLYKDTAYLPAAYIFELAGFSAVWDAKTKTTTVTRKK